MNFIREAGGVYIDEEAKQTLNQMIDRAVKAYCKANKSDPKDVIQSDNVYKRIYKKNLDSIPPIARKFSPFFC